MKKQITPALLLCTIVLYTTISPFACQKHEGKFSYKVIDGDTFHTRHDRIRIQGFDAPERGEPGCKEATEELARLLSSDSISIQPVAHDKYGRTVAKVFVDEENVALKMKVLGHQKKKKK